MREPNFNNLFEGFKQGKARTADSIRIFPAQKAL